MDQPDEDLNRGCVSRLASVNKPLGLAARLRDQTAVLHRAVEEQLGVPGNISTTVDYVTLLRRMLAFHRATERALHDERWTRGWADVRITIGDHDRADSIERDLRELNAVGELAPPRFRLSSIGEALGCLYVVEGSSLGGKTIGPHLRQRLGPVPTGYYDGDGRDHPRPWRSLQAALGAYELTNRDGDDVVSGAVSTFELIGQTACTPEALYEPV